MSQQQARNVNPNRVTAPQEETPPPEKAGHKPQEAIASEKSRQHQSNKSPNDFPDNFDE